MKKEVWTFDLETDAIDSNGNISKVWCGAFMELYSGRKRFFGPDEIPAMIAFIDTLPTVAAHNGIGFDLKWLRKLYGYEYKGKVIDTLVLSKLLKPNRPFPRRFPGKKISPHSVKTWGYRLGRYKVEHEDWSQFSEEMRHRCEEDVEIQQMIHEKLKEEMTEGDWRKAVPMTMKLFQILQKSEEYGWLVDQVHMNKAISMLNHWIRKIDKITVPILPMVVIPEETKILRENTYKYVQKPFVKSGRYTSTTRKWILNKLYPSMKEALGGREKWVKMVRTKKGERQRLVSGPYCRVNFRLTNLNSGEEVKDYLLAEGWIPEEWNINDEGERTSPKLSKDDPFIGIEGGVGKLIVKRVQCRHRKSTIEGWFKAIRPDGRISQRVTGLATTGRAKHQTIVNVPNGEAFFGKWMRQCFTVEDDKILIGVDSAGCQNRMLAARVGDDNFTKTLLEGKKEDKTSIHYVNQKALRDFGIEASYGQCKNANYAFMFGAGDTKLGNIIHGNDGTTIRKAFLSVSAGFEQLVNNLTEEWRENARMRKNKWGGWEWFNGWLPGLDGRPIFIPAEHMILVYILQSDEAIMMSYAYLFLYKWLEEAGLKWGDDWAYVAWNHDEFQIECKPEHKDLIVRLSEKSISYSGEYLNIACPHEGEADVGRTWYDTH